MTKLIRRAEWGARTPKAGASTSMVDHPSVTIHWEGEGRAYPWDHTDCDNMLRSIQNFHMNDRGWSDIAYNYVACPHDFLFEGRGLRRSAANGNDDWNAASYAICALWGDNSGKATDGLKRAINFGIQFLRDHGASTLVKGHRDWHSTDCPGDELYKWIKAGRPVAGDDDMNVAEFKAALAEACNDGQPLHELVQVYSAFGAKHSDQLVDDNAKAAGASTDLVLKDDFARMDARLAKLETNVGLILQALNKS